MSSQKVILWKDWGGGRFKGAALSHCSELFRKKLVVSVMLTARKMCPQPRKITLSIESVSTEWVLKLTLSLSLSSEQPQECVHHTDITYYSVSVCLKRIEARCCLVGCEGIASVPPNNNRILIDLSSVTSLPLDGAIALVHAVQLCMANCES